MVSRGGQPPLTGAELEALGREAERELAQAVVQKVHAPTARRLSLELRQPGRSVLLVVSGEPGRAYLGVMPERPPNPPTPPGWQSVLRRELTGARLADVEVLAARRLVLLHWKKGERALTLALEAGPEPGVLLLQRGGRVLALSRPAREGLKVGGEWTPPPEQKESKEPGPPAGAPRLASDFVALRLLHGAHALFQAEEARTARSDAAAPLQAALKKLARTREKVKGDLARAQQADRLRQEGEALASQLHRLKRGDAVAVLTRFTPEGVEETVTVALDPRRTLKEEVEHRFHQYRRMARGQGLARARLDELDAEEARLREAVARAEAGQGGEAPATAQRRGRPVPAAGRPYREYLGAGGQRIWVGRGAAHNDALTFQVAAPHHWWLHVRGVPGAHVVVPVDRSAELPAELLVDAAHLAHHHSPARGEPRSEVAYTQAKHVRKPRDAGPGAVTYTRERTLLLRVEPERLARLLKGAGA